MLDFIIYYFNNDWGAITQIAEYDIYILILKSLLAKITGKVAHGVTGKKKILINLVTCKKGSFKIMYENNTSKHWTYFYTKHKLIKQAQHRQD